MPKLILILLLLLPTFAFAECGFTRDGNAMVIVVGTNAKCLSSGKFREEFKADVMAALEESEAALAQKRAYDDRAPRAAKLWAIAERQFQARSGGRYFGQTR